MTKKTIGNKDDEGKKYEDDISDIETELHTNVEYCVKDYEKKRKKRREIGGGDGIELSAGENGVALEDGVDEDKKRRKKKKEKEHEVSVNVDELSGSRTQGVKESDMKDKKENEDMLESGSNDAGFDDNGNKVLMGSDVHRVKKKRSKKLDEISVNDFESGTTQSESVIEGGIDRNIFEKEKDKKKKKRKIKEVVEWQTNQEEQDFAETIEGEESSQRKKKKQQEMDKEGGDVIVTGKVTDREDIREREQLDGNIVWKVDIAGKEKKRKRKKHINAVGDVNSEFKDKDIGDDENNGVKGGNIEGHAVIEEGSNKEKKKKAKSVKDQSKGGSKKVPRTKKGASSENSTQKERSKKVSFSDKVEVFPLSDAKNSDDGLVRGK